MTPRSHIALLLGICLATGCAATALATKGHGNGARSSDATKAADPMPRSYEARYAAFGRARAAVDSPPAIVSSTLANVGRRFAVDASAARRIRAKSPTTYMLRVPGGACVVMVIDGGASGACSRDANILDATKPMYGVEATGDGRWRLTAVLPNNTRDIYVIGATGSRQQLDWEGNVGTVVLDAPPAELRWTLADSTEHSATVSDPRAVPQR